MSIKYIYVYISDMAIVSRNSRVGKRKRKREELAEEEQGG